MFSRPNKKWFDRKKFFFREIKAMKTRRKQLAISRGFRVKAVRESLRMTRKEFCNRHGFTISTLHSWERGDSCVTEEVGNLLVEAFENEKVQITLDWILKWMAFIPRNIKLI